MISRREPKVTVRPEIKTATKMTTRIITICIFPQSDLAGRLRAACHSAGVLNMSETSNPSAWTIRTRRRGVEEIDIRFGGKIWINGHIDQTAFLVGSYS